jgi:chromosome partitioning protein
MSLLDFLKTTTKPLTSEVRSILVVNSKGGSGKTTVATNLASYYAVRGAHVVLADFDPQASSLAWLSARPEDHPRIHGLAAWKDPLRIPRQTDTVIMDAPAGVHERQLARLARLAQTVLIPVLPSPLDIRAVTEFIENVLRVRQTADLSAKVAVLANRVRDVTRIADVLDEFLRGVNLPFVATLRDSQNYITAAERGLGLVELAPAAAAQDIEQWDPLVTWLRSKRSLPKAA